MKNKIIFFLILSVLSCGGKNEKANGDISIPDEINEPESSPDLFETSEPEIETLYDIPEIYLSGCPDAALQETSEIKEFRIEPEHLVLEAPLGDVVLQQFRAFVVYKDGSEVEIKNAAWNLTDISFGAIDNSGLFTSAANAGGETLVIATTLGLCTQAYLRVVQTYKDVSDAPDPNIEFLFKTGGDPATGQFSPNLIYPPDGALVPSDFSPITFQWLADQKFNSFELRLEAIGASLSFFGGKNWAKKDGYAYAIPKPGWEKIFSGYGVTKYQVKIIAGAITNGILDGGTYVSNTRTMNVTHEKAGGAFFYWNTATSSIKVLEMDNPPAYAIPISKGLGMCIGCHSVSPDAKAVAVSHFVGSGFTSMTMGIYEPLTGKTPPYVHKDAVTLLGAGPTILASFSPKYWTEIDKRIVVPHAKSSLNVSTKLISVDLLTGKYEEIVKGGDTGQHAFPTWSNSGEWVVYTSGKNLGMGFGGEIPTALYKVLYNDGKGGFAMPLTGADVPNMLQYYPVFSPDDKFIVFNRATENGKDCPVNLLSDPNNPGSGGTYDNCYAELFIIQSEGGMPVRLDAANGESSPGVANSWPTFGIVMGKYYWLAFSSRREYGFLHTGKNNQPPAPQVWITAVDREKLIDWGKDPSTPALWLPNQDA
ncbi:MAG: hypothetical protein FJ088_02550, partial [Deltaproteobacteria bacterium]|nr:hypothetical protein [Deltaproteobacteria bacterium]